MLTREQAYAADVFQRVSTLKEKEPAKVKKYGATAHQLPLLIRSAGLVQALTFIDSRKDDSNSLKCLLDDLAKTVGKKDREELVKRSREAKLAEYMRLTQQTMAALLWYKRFAQSVLDVTAADARD